MSDTNVSEAKKNSEPKKLTGILAINYAVKNNVALDYKAQKAIPIGLIVASENPRQEPARLVQQGLKLIDAKDPKNSIVHMSLSDDWEDVERLVKMAEEFENDNEAPLKLTEGEVLADDLSNLSISKEDLKGQQSIVSLGRSIGITQLQPAIVRPKGSSNFTLLFGQRRLAAVAYWHAKTRLLHKESPKEYKVHPPILMCVESDVNKDDAFDMAVQENRQRKDFTPLQWSAIIHEYLRRKNPVTKKPYTLTEIAPKIGLEYGITRNRWALLLPRTEAVKDENGNVIKAARGLTDEEREKLERDEVTLSWATKRALGESSGPKRDENGARQTTRAKAIPLAKMQELFDNSSESNLERRQAIAECMGLEYQIAVLESEKRIQESDLKPKKKGKRKKTSDPVQADDAPPLGEPDEETGPAGEEVG